MRLCEVSLTRTTKGEPSRVATFCVTTLSALAQRRPGHVTANRTVATFYQGVLRSSLPSFQDPLFLARLDVLLEVLDGIMDVWGDRDFDYDENYWEVGLSEVMAELPLATLAKRVDRRRWPELRTKADIVKVNVLAFLKYKEGERKRVA